MGPWSVLQPRLTEWPVTTSDFTPHETVGPETAKSTHRDGQFVFPLLPHAPLTLFPYRLPSSGACRAGGIQGTVPAPSSLEHLQVLRTCCSFLQQSGLWGGREGRGEAAGSSSTSKGSQLLSWPHMQAGRWVRDCCSRSSQHPLWSG